MIKAIVTDIEGTTSSLSFVKDVLFPYARANLAAFVKNHQHETQVKPLLDDACREAGISFDLDALIAQFIRWIDEDKKITPLKSLQGLIWEAGYNQGDFKGHIYPDAVECLKIWKGQGIHLYVYSSGSVHAQKLLFAHTEFGDLTPLFSGYFDTHIGGKREAESYRNIETAIGVPAAQILFLSDIKEELDAAKASGFKTVWLKREVEQEACSEHAQAPSFSAISLSALLA